MPKAQREKHDDEGSILKT